MPRIYRSLTAGTYSSPPSAQPSPRIRIFHEQLPDYAPTPTISLPSVARELSAARVLLKNGSGRLGLLAFNLKILGAVVGECSGGSTSSMERIEGGPFPT